MRTRLNPVSKRRRRRDRVYAQRRREAYARAAGRCEALMFADDCTGQAEQTHHIAGRTGPDPHRLENLLVVCAPCHGEIHAHSAAARLRGFMRSRLTDSEGDAYGGGAA